MAGMFCTTQCRYGVVSGPVALGWLQVTLPKGHLQTMANCSEAMKLKYRTPSTRFTSKKMENIIYSGEVSGAYMFMNLLMMAWHLNRMPKSNRLPALPMKGFIFTERMASIFFLPQ